MINMNKIAKRAAKKAQRVENLENGRRQFETLARPQATAYVWVNNISLPVAISR